MRFDPTGTFQFIGACFDHYMELGAYRIVGRLWPNLCLLF